MEQRDIDAASNYEQNQIEWLLYNNDRHFDFTGELEKAFLQGIKHEQAKQDMLNDNKNW